MVDGTDLNTPITFIMGPVFTPTRWLGQTSRSYGKDLVNRLTAVSGKYEAAFRHASGKDVRE